MSKKVFIIVVATIVLLVSAPIIMVIVWDDESITNSEEDTDIVKENAMEENTIKENTVEESIVEENIVEENITEENTVEEDLPYMPNGFSYVEGKVETGYTIADSYGNTYVWVPVENGELIRNIDISECVEIENMVTDFKNSVNQYKGFYIAKYESSAYSINNKNVSATMGDRTPVNNVNYAVAYETANNSYKEFNYSDVVTNLINSYAWDTTLAWIDKSNSNYSTSTNRGNYSETINPTGTTEADIVNNICDLAGNLEEWTTEGYLINNDTVNQQLFRIIRGGSVKFNGSALNRSYKEDGSDYNIGFRMILYKT